MSSSDTPGVNEGTAESTLGGRNFTDPICKPIGIAFSPLMDAVEAATNHIANQTLIGLVSLQSKAVGNCTVNITSTLPSVIMVPSQVVIPDGFTTQRVYGVFRANTGAKVTAVNIYAGGLTIPARIVIPPTANNPAPDFRELAAIVEVKTVHFDSPLQGYVELVANAPPGGTIVYLSVNLEYQPYFHLPVINTAPPAYAVIVPEGTSKADIPVTVMTPPDPLTFRIYGQSGDNPVESNDITI